MVRYKKNGKIFIYEVNSGTRLFNGYFSDVPASFAFGTIKKPSWHGCARGIEVWQVQMGLRR